MGNDRFTIEVRFDGRLATSGDLDASDHETAVGSARRLFAAHAHAFLHRKVPSAAIADGSGYHVRHSGSASACHVDYWTVVIGVAAISAQLYPGEIRGAIASCAQFFRSSLRSVAFGEKNDAEFVRIEPILEMSTGNRAPMLDLECDLQAVRRELAALTERVLFNGVARPVGRSAERLSIILDGEPTIVIDEASKQQHLQREIGQALKAIKSQRTLLQH